jgi:hypothetical protein
MTRWSDCVSSDALLVTRSLPLLNRARQTASLNARIAVELPLVDAADEGIPLGLGEVQDGPSRVLAVANPDPVVGQACDLYAVTVVSA